MALSTRAGTLNLRHVNTVQDLHTELTIFLTANIHGDLPTLTRKVIRELQPLALLTDYDTSSASLQTAGQHLALNDSMLPLDSEGGTIREVFYPATLRNAFVDHHLEIEPPAAHFKLQRPYPATSTSIQYVAVPTEDFADSTINCGRTSSCQQSACTHHSFAKMLLHFVVTQSLPIISFYVGLYGYLALLSYWVATHQIIHWDHEALVRGLRNSNLAPRRVVHLGEFLDCVQTESMGLIASLSWSLNLTCIGHPGKAIPWGVPVPRNVLFTEFNYTGVLLVLVFVLLHLVKLCCSCPGGLGQGRYIAFTYGLQRSCAYRTMSTILVLFILFIFFDTCLFLWWMWSHGSSRPVINFVQYLLPTLLALIYSAGSLMQGSTEPFFNYDSNLFAELNFKRGWDDVFVDNNAYAQKLGVAILYAQYGHPDPLHEMCANPVEQVLRACEPVRPYHANEGLSILSREGSV